MAVPKLVSAASSGKSCKILLGLRLLAFSATLSAAIVMGLNLCCTETETGTEAGTGTGTGNGKTKNFIDGKRPRDGDGDGTGNVPGTGTSSQMASPCNIGLNKETKTFVVGNVGNTPVKATFTAKFQHTPAFVFFVVANAMVSFHNFLMIALQIFGGKMEFTGFRLLSVAILDMLNVTLVSAAANAAAFMAEVGKNGNKHARWNKICDRFATYCDHGAGALIAAFAGVILMLIISAVTISRLVQPNKCCSTAASPSVVP